MSSDSENDILEMSSDVSIQMSNLQEKFLQKFNSSSARNAPNEQEAEECNSPPVRRSARAKKKPASVSGKIKKTTTPSTRISPFTPFTLPTPSGRVLRSQRTEPMPSTSMLVETDESEGGSSTKRKRPSKEKPRKKKEKVTKKQPDIHDESTDEDVMESKNMNPSVLINVLWRSVDSKKFAVRKFDNLSVICDYLVKKYSVNPKLLLFTLNDKEIDLDNNTYVSLRLTDEVVIEGGVLPESYLGKENVNSKQKSGMKIKVQYEERKSFFVFLLPEDTLDVVYSEVNKKLNLPVDKFKVRFDGEVVKHSDSVSGLGLEEGDVFDIIVV